MILNDKWQDFWVKYIEIPDTLKFIIQYTSKKVLAIHKMLEAIRQMANALRNCFRNIYDKFRSLLNCLEEFKQEEITCNNCRCNWTNYNYKPQLMKVNTKGYSRCFLPVTRRYI